MKKRSFLTVLLCIGFLSAQSIFIGFTSVDSKGNCVGYGFKCLVIDLRDAFQGYRADLSSNNGKLVVTLPVKQLSRADLADIKQNGLNLSHDTVLDDRTCDALKKPHGTIIKAGKYTSTSSKTEIFITLEQPATGNTGVPAVNRQR